MSFNLLTTNVYTQVILFLQQHYNISARDSEQQLKVVCQDAAKLTSGAFYTKYKIRNYSDATLPIPSEIIILTAAFPFFTVYFFYQTQEITMFKRNTVDPDDIHTYKFCKIPTNQFTIRPCILFQHVPFSNMDNFYNGQQEFKVTEKETRFVKSIQRKERRNGLLVAARMKNGAYFHIFKWIVLFL